MNGRWPSGTAALVVLILSSASSFAFAAQDADNRQDSGEQAKAAEQTKQSETDGAFSYDEVVAKAEALAAKAYEPREKIPKFLQNLGFSGLNKIRFKNDHALWQGDKIPFEARFYHLGSFFVYPVTMHTVTSDGAQVLPFSTDQFEYPSDKLRERIPDNLGYAGVVIMHRLNSPDELDELVSFLGASYFRALPKKAHYGMSARGLAIDTALSSGEEFPAFTDFWLVQPEPGDETVTLYALLDTPSVAGAYKFVVDPGKTTTMQVETTLFTRSDIKKLGIAPLTSMFTWGENSLHRRDHSRPEAHDSDGLLIHNSNGEWLWRPLKNPQTLTINQFVTDNVRGFGLLQRDRNFLNYQNLNYEYELRPGLWVEPQGDWGKGVVELVQIPSDSEINDNIVAYWVPEKPVKAGQTLRYAYTLKWLMHDPSDHERATTQATRIGYGSIVREGQERDKIKLAIEFTGGQLDELTDPTTVEPHVNPMRDVTLNNIKVMRNPHTGGWRLSFLVPTSALGEPLELRAYLAKPGGQPLTETWTYTLTQ